MCEWGKEVVMLVPVPLGLSCSGMAEWKMKGVDRCISDIVLALNKCGVLTASCCCGHGKEPGTIVLQDGRTLRIQEEME